MRWCILDCEDCSCAHASIVNLSGTNLSLMHMLLYMCELTACLTFFLLHCLILTTLWSSSVSTTGVRQLWTNQSPSHLHRLSSHASLAGSFHSFWTLDSNGQPSRIQNPPWPLVKNWWHVEREVRYSQVDNGKNYLVLHQATSYTCLVSL